MKSQEFLQLLSKYHHQKVGGWFVSEKSDGMRGFWDGQSLWTRHRNIIPAPQEWLDCLPDFPLDGELWIGRNRARQTISTVLSHRRDAKAWARIIFKVFEAPNIAQVKPQAVVRNNLGALHASFESNYGYLRQHLPICDTVHLVHQMRLPQDCTKALVDEILAAILSQGGEGIVLRAPRSIWKHGRVNHALKHKTLSLNPDLHFRNET